MDVYSRTGAFYGKHFGRSFATWNKVSLLMLQAAECGVEIFDIRNEGGYNSKYPFPRMGCPVHSTH